MSVKIAINGFGRIGRDFLRIAIQRNSDFELVAVNNGSATPETIAHLFKYDSIFGRFPGEIYEISLGSKQKRTFYKHCRIIL